MKTTYSNKEYRKKDSDSSKSFLNELCHQSPFLVINTPCGTGKYKFNKIGYDDSNNLVVEYMLVMDNKYQDSNIIAFKLGKFYYLSASQLLYAFKYYANT